MVFRYVLLLFLVGFLSGCYLSYTPPKDDGSLATITYRYQIPDYHYDNENLFKDFEKIEILTFTKENCQSPQQIGTILKGSQRITTKIPSGKMFNTHFYIQGASANNLPAYKRVYSKPGYRTVITASCNVTIEFEPQAGEHYYVAIGTKDNYCMTRVYTRSGGDYSPVRFERPLPQCKVK